MTKRHRVETLTAADSLVLSALQAGCRTVPQIAEWARIELSAARAHLTKLRGMDRVRRYGATKSAHYVAVRPRRLAALLVLALAYGCSSSPTSPTPTGTYPLPPPVTTVPPVVVPPPVVAAPAPVPPAPDPRLSDPRFDRAFYDRFVLGLAEGWTAGVRRLTQPPRIYLRTVDDAGAAIDARTLDETAAALINTTGQLTGVFGVAGLERGTGTKVGERGWLTIQWADQPSASCGIGYYAVGLMVLYPKTPGCRCTGGAAGGLRVVKHELGHLLGFFHSDSTSDLMYPSGSTCDMPPSAREVFHAGIAYSQPIGSRDPR